MTSVSSPSAAANPETSGVHLLVIDAQNDFCDIPGAALPVPGADADMQRLAAMIRANLSAIDAITLTLDSHYRIDIAHPGFWRAADGEVSPFTSITARQVRDGVYAPRRDEDAPRVLAYLDALEARGRYTHMVWPVHCVMGTRGHNLHADVADACAAWEDFHGRQALRVFKGMNPWTEHYSAVQAEVPLDDDASTQKHQALLQRLAPSRRLLVAGEAGSHCVKATVEDLVGTVAPRNIVLLLDAMSPVTGFDSLQQSFVQSLLANGALAIRTDQALRTS